MKLVDSNVWLALAVSGHGFHVVAHAWMTSQTAPGEALFCRSTQQSFLRLLTTTAVMQPYGDPALTNREAWTLYEGLLTDPRVGWSDEPPGLQSHWKVFATRNTASPKLWMDAYLAAFAVAGQHQLVTTDAAYAQYAGLNLLVLTQSPAQP
jgi:toxin-antitoxin system PIN domain toxin